MNSQDSKNFGKHTHETYAYSDGMAAIHKLNEIQESLLLKSVPFFTISVCLSSVNSTYIIGLVYVH